MYHWRALDKIVKCEIDPGVLVVGRASTGVLVYYSLNNNQLFKLYPCLIYSEKWLILRLSDIQRNILS